MSGQHPGPGFESYDPQGEYGLNPQGGGAQPGQPAQGEAGFGGPQGGYAGQGYQAPGGFAAPGYGPSQPGPGGGYPPPPNGGSAPYGQTPPPKKKSPLGMILGIAGGALALIILGTVALVVVVINNRPDETVMKYFEALQAGNAEEAISYARYQPEDTTLLTDEVLQKSNELGGITDVEITRSSNDRVTVSMRINGSTETGYYKVAKTDDGWKLDEVAWNLGMARMGEKAPLVVNGVEVTDPANVVVFPGVYELTTGTDNVAWTDPKQAVVGGDLQLPGGLHRLVLTPEGEQAARDGVAALFDNCLKSKKFRPKGCPFGLSEPPPGADESTVKWVTEGNPADEWNPSLRDDPTAVEGFLVYTLRLQFTYSQNGQTREYDRPAVLSQVFFVDLTTDPVGVTWEN